MTTLTSLNFMALIEKPYLLYFLLAIKFLVLLFMLYKFIKRKKILRQLSSSEKTYRMIFENSSKPMLVVDTNLNILKANTAFEHLTGYIKNELEGLQKFVHFFDAKNFQKNLSKNIENDWFESTTWHLSKSRHTNQIECNALVSRINETKNLLIILSALNSTKHQEADKSY